MMAKMVLAYAIPPRIMHKIVKFFNDSTLRQSLLDTLGGLGIQHQSWYMQATEEDGGVFISVWEADDPGAAIGKFVSSEEPFAVTLKEHFRICSGSDIGQQVEAVPLRLPLGPATLLFEC
jgi:hypothetical protein